MFRLGRHKSLLVSLTLAVVFGVLVCVSPSPPVFITMRFCLAAASAGVYLTLYITRESNTHGTDVINIRALSTVFVCCGFVMILHCKKCRYLNILGRQAELGVIVAVKVNISRKRDQEGVS